MKKQLYSKAGDLPAGTDIYINEGDSYAAFTVISQSYRSDNELALLIRKEPLPCTVEFMSNLYSAFDRDKLIRKRNLLNNANVLLNEAYPTRFPNFMESTFQIVPVNKDGVEELSVFFLPSHGLLQSTCYSDSFEKERIAYKSGEPLNWLLQRETATASMRCVTDNGKILPVESKHRHYIRPCCCIDRDEPVFKEDIGRENPVWAIG